MPAHSLLIIDDDQVDRKVILRALQSLDSNCLVTEVDTGRQGVELAMTRPFDCILLDYRLPDGDGLDRLTELRALPGVNAPIVILTGEGNELVAVEAMKRGATDYLPKAALGADALYRAIANAVEKHDLQRRLADAHSQLEHLALYDELTGLGNRNLFNRELGRAVATASRKDLPFCLLLMDLNRFKACNDTHGHQAGDAVLATIGQRLRDLARASDSYYRLGGDEFAAILDTSAACNGAATVARRLKDILPRPIPFEDKLLEVGVSIGYAIHPDHGETADEMIRAADAAMYADKAGAR
jgi:diguanylate cyclase (GGDEF)-like protein